MDSFNNRDFSLTVAVPKGIIYKEEKGYYVFMDFFEFETLENHIIKTGISDKNHLKNIRQIYDDLESNNIFWKDMASRNILIENSNKKLRYILLDFEKTEQFDKRDKDKQNSFWRGPVISEEFSSIFDFNDLLGVFGDKFNPKNWNYNDNTKISISDMRYEIKEIVESNKERYGNLTWGEYNKWDRKLLKTRSPIIINGSKLYPGKMCFLIDHALGKTYDRKFNEILIHTRKSKWFEYIVYTMNSLLQCNKISVENFRLSGNVLKHTPDYEPIKLWIDYMYDNFSHFPEAALQGGH